MVVFIAHFDSQQVFKRCNEFFLRQPTQSSGPNVGQAVTQYQMQMKPIPELIDFGVG